MMWSEMNSGRPFAILAVTVLAVGLSCCGGHPTGTISGRLVAVGGPVTRPRPLRGTVEFTGPETKEVTVGSDGTFQIDVPAGTYIVEGRSPLYNGGRSPCRPSANAVVHDAATTNVLVTCQEL
jgi:hypothetical protein